MYSPKGTRLDSIRAVIKFQIWYHQLVCLYYCFGSDNYISCPTHRDVIRGFCLTLQVLTTYSITLLTSAIMSNAELLSDRTCKIRKSVALFYLLHLTKRADPSDETKLTFEISIKKSNKISRVNSHYEITADDHLGIDSPGDGASEATACKTATTRQQQKLCSQLQPSTTYTSSESWA